MKLYILRPKENLPYEDSPWNPWYDKCFGEVVRANNAKQARKIANSIFENPKFSTCEELKQIGKAESIIEDVHWA